MRLRSRSLALVIALLLIALTVGMAACGTAAVPSPSSTASKAPSIATSSSTPTSLPAAGSSMQLTSTDAAVPVGKLLEVITRDPTGGESEYLVLDTHGHRGYREMASPAPTPGYSIMIFDDSGHRTMDGVNLEVYPDPPAGETSASYSQIAQEDPLAGRTATVTGTEVIDGQETLVVETVLSVPGSPSVTVTANLDPTTGLRVREKWQLESQTQQTERKLLDSTPDLLAKLDRDSIQGVAATFREQRTKKLRSLSYPVLGLPSSAGDFKLLWLIPGLNWGSVRLEYELSSSPGHPSATVISTDLKTNPKNAQMFSSSLEKAVVETGEGDVLRFRQGDSGIQVQASADIIRRLASELVQVGGLGS